jgi:hypothetical protein
MPAAALSGRPDARNAEGARVKQLCFTVFSSGPRHPAPVWFCWIIKSTAIVGNSYKERSASDFRRLLPEKYLSTAGTIAITANRRAVLEYDTHAFRAARFATFALSVIYIFNG